jgi:hypothetical protein
MIPPSIRQALFSEIHRSIEEAARACVAGIVSPDGLNLGYPPNGELTEGDRAALRTLAVSLDARAALEKVVADACSHPFFHLFSVMDGVADPEADVGDWPGVTLASRREDDEEMLHDEFYESWWDYKKGH